jgi:hypothetical protein
MSSEEKVVIGCLIESQSIGRFNASVGDKNRQRMDRPGPVKNGYRINRPGPVEEAARDGN